MSEIFPLAETIDVIILLGIIIGLVTIYHNNRTSPDEHSEVWGDYPYKEERKSE